MSSPTPRPYSPDAPPGAGSDVQADMLRAILERAAPVEAAHYDELREPGGQMRPAWQRFFGHLGLPRLEDLDRREALLARQLHEDGVTYNVYSDGGQAHPWPLQLLPMLVEPEDWRHIEAGVQQRAALLNGILADVYSDQRVLREGLLPPALVLGHPGYLRQLHGHVPQGGVFLHIAAFDLARGSDGRFWVTEQRMQAPSGLGYVLENRLAVSRLFPQPFRELHVQHLASGYRRLLDTLQELAAPCAQGQPPRLALLTPGPYNETYFEHVYLARYLGLPLVEGADLIVRDERVYLKTVKGLERVHGLLRRLDDDFCDPLELRPDSTLGVPGLLQAVRAGHVVMANALGTGFLESPAVQSFMPAIAQRWLGQELLLPCVPSWWCGEPAAWQGVQEELAGKLVFPTYPQPPGDPAQAGLRHAFEPTLLGSDAEQLAVWRGRIEADAGGYTLRGSLAHSQCPSWRNGSFEAEGLTLRVYAISDGHGGWQVLPGGMGRSARSHLALSMQQGGASRDIWVLTDGAVDTFSMLPKPLRVEDLVKQQRPVSSRTAENLFWLGRYTERTENLVRLARVILAVLAEDDEAASPEVLDALGLLAVRAGLVAPNVPTPGQSQRLFERALVEALPRPWPHTSVAFNLGALERAAAALRDRLSPEVWRMVHGMGESFAARLVRPGPLSAAEATPALEWLGVQLAAVTGVQLDRMTRDAGWRLLAVGRYIERLIAHAEILSVFFERQAAAQPQGFDVLLALFDSTITFRSRFQRRLELPALLDLLVMDEANPRALACVLRRLRIELRKLPVVSGEPVGQGAAVEAAPSVLGGDTIESLLAHLPPEGVGLSLGELCDPLWFTVAPHEAAAQPVPLLAARLGQAAARLSDEIGWRYFAHAGVVDRLLAAS